MTGLSHILTTGSTAGSTVFSLYAYHILASEQVVNSVPLLDSLYQWIWVGEWHEFMWAGAWVVVGIILCVLGGILPDIDLDQSVISQLIGRTKRRAKKRAALREKAEKNYLRKRGRTNRSKLSPDEQKDLEKILKSVEVPSVFGEHRTTTHTIWAVLILGVLASFFHIFFFLVFGYVLHLVLDSFSTSGVCWFWPFEQYKRVGQFGKVKRGKHLSLYKTSNPSEYILVGVYLVLVLGPAIYLGYQAAVLCADNISQYF